MKNYSGMTDAKWRRRSLKVKRLSAIAAVLVIAVGVGVAFGSGGILEESGNDMAPPPGGNAGNADADCEASESDGSETLGSEYSSVEEAVAKYAEKHCGFASVTVITVSGNDAELVCGEIAKEFGVHSDANGFLIFNPTDTELVSAGLDAFAERCDVSLGVYSDSYSPEALIVYGIK